MFGKKRDFKPDKVKSWDWSKLLLTKKQQLTLWKWLLLSLVLVAMSLLQDVVLSRIRLFGTTTDLLVCTIFLACIMQDTDVGCLFALISSTLYLFSGSAPGAYVIALITVIGTVVSIFRQCYLRKGFGSVVLCTGVAIFLYEMIIFFIGLFLEQTTLSRLPAFCICAGLSLAVMPLLYPIFHAISKIGGETWKE